MQMRKNPYMVDAENLLNLLANGALDDVKLDEVEVDWYRNDREHGYILHTPDILNKPCVYVGFGRDCERIFVYVEPYNSTGPTEAGSWHKAKVCATPGRAVEAIAEALHQLE